MRSLCLLLVVLVACFVFCGSLSAEAGEVARVSISEVDVVEAAPGTRLIERSRLQRITEVVAVECRRCGPSARVAKRPMLFQRLFSRRSEVVRVSASPLIRVRSRCVNGVCSQK